LSVEVARTDILRRLGEVDVRRLGEVDATAGVETSVALISLLPEKRGITRAGTSCRGKSRQCGLRASLVSFGS